MTFPFYDYDSDFFSTEDLLFLAGASGKAVEETATGNPMTFQTDLAKPLRSLLIPFTPIQSGTGDPSPSNIRSILPWNGLKVFGGGVNLCSGGWVDGGIDNNTGAEDADTARMRSEYFPIKGGANYLVVSNDRFKRVFFYDKEKTFISSDVGSRAEKTAPNNAYYARAVIIKETTQPGEFSFNYPSTATAYEPYKPITETDIVFPSPVYGGTLDVVSGVMTKEFVSVDLGGQTWRKRSENQSRQIWEAYFNEAKFGGTAQSISANAYCSEFSLTTSNGAWTPGMFAPALESKVKVFIFSVPAGSYADGTECKEAMTGIQLVYELSTPQEITLTPEQITAIVGDNTIWSDADGSMTAVFLKKG